MTMMLSPAMLARGARAGSERSIARYDHATQTGAPAGVESHGAFAVEFADLTVSSPGGLSDGPPVPDGDGGV